MNWLAEAVRRNAALPMARSTFTSVHKHRRARPGKGWFARLRCYSRTEAFFDQTGMPVNIVQVQ